MISFVFFKWQIALMFIPEHDMHYWESWLYYTRETKGNTAERIAQCIKEAPQTWTRYHADDTKETTDYYNLILKTKWL
jgi:ribulose bisphosphate carboxylase small subunit